MPDLEIDIVHELAQEVLQYEEALVHASDICGELDRFNLIFNIRLEIYLHPHSLLALAQGAQIHKFNRLRMTENNVIEICAGR